MKHSYLIVFLIILAGGEICAQAPKVASFNPLSGSAGTTVTIKGSGFSTVADSNVVYFGAARASVTTASTTQLLVTVPAGATYKPISVVNKITRLTGYSTLAFSTSFSPAITGVSARIRLLPDTGASDIQIKDLDGDGKTDILAINPTMRKLMVLHNKSEKAGELDDRAFTEPVMYKTGQQPGFVAVEDFDGDGKADIILMNVGYATTANDNNSLTFFHNLSIPGKIQLSAVPVIDSTETTPAVYNFQLKPGDKLVRISDFDGDGKLDLAILNTGGFISIYRNTYSPGKPFNTILSPPVTIPLELYPTSFTIGDMDSDGKLDIIATNYNNASITILRNVSTTGSITASSFQRVDIALGYSPLAVTLVDVDGDNKLDAVISRADGKPTAIIHNTSAPGNFSGTSINLSNVKSISNYNNDIVLQDINGDARPDLLSLNADLNSVYLYTNKSAPGQTNQNYFENEVNCPVVTIPDCIGDLDGDGMPDMLVGSIFGIDIYRGKSTIVPTPQLRTLKTDSVLADMVIYPNPASISTNVKYTLPFQSKVILSVFDGYGKMLKSIKTDMQAAGSHVLTIETSNLNKGLYIITITANGYNKIGKLMIVN